MAQKYKKTRQRRTNWWRDIRRLLTDQNAEDAKREKRQQQLALPPCDACRPIKKCPVCIPNCVDGRSCFLSIRCLSIRYGKSYNAETTSKQEDTVQLRCCRPATELSLFFFFSTHLKFPVLPLKSGMQLGNGSATSSLLSVTWQLQRMDYW